MMAPLRVYVVLQKAVSGRQHPLLVYEGGATVELPVADGDSPQEPGGYLSLE